MKTRLSKAEKKISEDLEKGRYRSLGKAKAKKYSQMANAEANRRKLNRKEERINIRLTSEDLENLKERADAEGLPYQTLVTSVLHKYIVGSLVDVNNVSAIKRALKD